MITTTQTLNTLDQSNMAQSYFPNTSHSPSGVISAEPDQIADAVAHAEDVQKAYLEQKDRYAVSLYFLDNLSD